VKQWAEDTGRVNHLFTPLSAGQTNCSDIRWSKYMPWRFARIGERLFVPATGNRLEVIDLDSLQPNRIIEIPILSSGTNTPSSSIEVSGIVAVPGTEDLVVSTSVKNNQPKLMRISSVTLEVIWGPTDLPDFDKAGVGYGDITLAANKSYIACRPEDSDKITLLDIATGEILSLGVQLRKWPLWALRKFGFYETECERGLLLASSDGALIAGDPKNGKVYRWADPINKPSERTAITRHLRWKLCWQRARSKTLTLLIMVVLAIFISKMVQVFFAEFYPLAQVLKAIVIFVSSYCLALYSLWLLLLRTDNLDTLCGLTQTPDGKIALSYWTGILVVADGVTGRTLRILETGTKNQLTPCLSGIETIDETRVAVAKENGRCEVWNIETGKKDSTLAGSTRDILGISATSNDVIVIDRNFKTRRWRVDSELDSTENQTPQMRTLAVARSPDGRRWAVTSYFSSCHLWNLDKANEAPTQLINDLGCECGPAFTHDGSAVVLRDNNARRFLIWDMQAACYTSLNWKHLWDWPRAERWWQLPLLILFSPLIAGYVIGVLRRRWLGLRAAKHPNQNLSVACDTTSLGLYWPLLLAKHPILFNGKLGDRSQVASNPKFPNLLVASGCARGWVFESSESGNSQSNENRGCVIVLNTISGETRILRDDGASVGGIALTNEGHVVALDNDGLWLWIHGVTSTDVEPIKLGETVVDEGDSFLSPPRYISYGGDRWIAALPGLGEVALWDVAERKLVKQWRNPPEGNRRSRFIAATNDGRVVTLSDDNLMVDLWDESSDTPVASYPLTDLPGDMRIIDDLVVVITFNEGLTVLKLPPKKNNIIHQDI
jgi:WD40 repeat protein